MENYAPLETDYHLPPFFLGGMCGLLVDVVEIGEKRRNIGEILKVKPLAALAMIDEGELDWKIIAIALDDPKASLVNDVEDVEKHFPVCIRFLFIFISLLDPSFSRQFA